jgi:two-component system, cell cycle response regulator
LRNILIAEDEKNLRYLLAMTLKSWGYGVVETHSGTEAWDALQGEGAPMLAILDWQMPGMEGVEVVKKIREEGLNTYVLLLTSLSRKAKIVEGLEAGADDYVVKPFDPPELRARVRAGERILDLQQKLLEMSLVDQLTGLANRRRWDDSVTKEWRRAARTKQPLGLIMMDLDKFKNYNDTYGHPAGDDCLQKVGKALKDATQRAGDLVARYGGEEFTVLLPNTDAEGVRAVGDEMREAVRALGLEHINGRSADNIMTISQGGAVMVPDTDKAPEVLVDKADARLYKAKEAGGDQLVMAE